MFRKTQVHCILVPPQPVPFGRSRIPLDRRDSLGLGEEYVQVPNHVSRNTAVGFHASTTTPISNRKPFPLRTSSERNTRHQVWTRQILFASSDPRFSPPP